MFGVNVSVEPARSRDAGLGCALNGLAFERAVDEEGSTYSEGSSLGEVICGKEVPCYSSVETCIAVVSSISDRILEAAGVFQGKMKLALLSLVRLSSVGTNVGLCESGEVSSCSQGFMWGWSLRIKYGSMNT